MSKQIGLIIKVCVFFAVALILSTGEIDETGRLSAPPLIELAALGLLFFFGEWLYTRREKRKTGSPPR